MTGNVHLSYCLLNSPWGEKCHLPKMIICPTTSYNKPLSLQIVYLSGIFSKQKMRRRMIHHEFFALWIKYCRGKLVNICIGTDHEQTEKKCSRKELHHVCAAEISGAPSLYHCPGWWPLEASVSLTENENTPPTVEDYWNNERSGIYSTYITHS